VDGQAVITLAAGTEYNVVSGTGGSGTGATFDFIVSDSPDGVSTTFDDASIQFEAPVDMYDPH
jgi:hypothetical protein